MARVLLLGSYSESLINFRGPLLRAIRDKGHEVFACAPQANPAVRQQLANWGIIYRRIELQRTGLNPFKDLFSICKMIQLFRSVLPDIIFAYTIKPVIYGILAARMASIPKRCALITGLGYTFTNDTFKKKVLNTIVRQLYKLALQQAQLAFFQNPDDLALFQRWSLLDSPVKQVVVNGSGVDLSHYQKAALPDQLAFLLISRLLKEKGIREYVEAARSLKANYPDIAFHLVGWIDDAPSAIAKSELKAWQQEGIIEFWGKLSDVRPAICASSVYVLPSYREGTPRSVLEAMAMGRPIITTDAPGCRETVKHGVNGFLVPVRDVPALADAMEQFIRKPDLIKKMGIESRKIAVDKYDVNKVNAKILSSLGLA